ncbi:MAG: acylphosphatase [Haliea sp.]
MRTTARHFRVSGKVQGVFFRASTQARAQALGLNGWVRNSPDGSVELLANGTAEALQQLEDWLWQGPDRARVTAVEATPAPLQPHAGFAIRR